MKVNYIKCMDFTFEDVELPEYNNIDELRKDIEESKTIKIVSTDNITEYINADYIMFVGEYK